MTLLKDRIVQAIRAKGITNAELARRVGVQRATVGDWTKGRTAQITGSTLLKVARVLGVRPEWLSTGHGPIATNADDPPGVKEPVATYSRKTLGQLFERLTERQQAAVSGIVAAMIEANTALMEQASRGPALGKAQSEPRKARKRTSAPADEQHPDA